METKNVWPERAGLIKKMQRDVIPRDSKRFKCVRKRLRLQRELK